MPFREQVGGKTNIPCIPVSTKNMHKWTLYDLSRLTTELVRKHLTEDVAFLSAVAQQVCPSMKLEAVIAVAKKWYWKGLASAINLPGNQTEIVWQNFHKDIIRIWNLQDPKELFNSNEFKKLTGVLVDGQGLLSVEKVYKSLKLTLNIVLHRLMNYIVFLMLIMQIVLEITTSTENIVSRYSIKIAMEAIFIKKIRVPSAIEQDLRCPGAFLDRDAALQKKNRTD